MTITPNAYVVAEMVEDNNCWFDTIRRHFRLETQQRILSVFYIRADEKCKLLGLHEMTSLDMALCPDRQNYVLVRSQVMEELLPKIFNFSAYLAEKLFEFGGPSPPPTTELEKILETGFTGKHTQIQVGLKKGFFGGTKPDIRFIPFPLVANIEHVLR